MLPPSPISLPYRQRGFTLLELIISLTIGSILMAVAIPAIAQLNAQYKHQANKNELLNLIKLARENSVNQNTYTNICNLVNNQCNGVSSPLSLYSDSNNNGKLDKTEKLIAIRSISNAQLNWNRYKRIRFTPKGHASGYNGTLSFCNESGGFKIIIARTGRIRTQNTHNDCTEN